MTSPSSTRSGRRSPSVGSTPAGAPVSLGRLVYVPGTIADGRRAVWVFDPESSASVSPFPVNANGPVNLGVQQGRVWWQDGTVAGRGSIGASGTTTVVQPVTGGAQVLGCDVAGLDPTSPGLVTNERVQLTATRTDGGPRAPIRWRFEDEVIGDRI